MLNNLTATTTVGIINIPTDPRICLLPKEVKRITSDLKMNVLFEAGVGLTLGIKDSEYANAGGKVSERTEIFENSDFIISLNHVFNGEKLKPNSSFIGIFNPFFHSAKLQDYDKCGASIYSLDLLPRSTLAQSMDVLSSMASLSGYRAVLKGADLYNGVIPMFTTAAGTLNPTKVLILGAGVAGLQAIATARRLGAVVEAFDVRKSAGEEVRSLGASFIEVEGYTENKDAGGYAVAQSDEYLIRQKQLIHDHIISSNIVISTANIPGKKAPILIERHSVAAMQPGSVIIDLAAEQGGNCYLSQNNEIITYQDVIIVGNSNLSAEIPKAASQLLSNNFFSFLKYLISNNKDEDPLLSSCKIMDEGAWYHPHFKKELQTN